MKPNYGSSVVSLVTVASTFFASPCAATAADVGRNVIHLESRRVPRVVNGIRTHAFPEVGAFLIFDGEGFRTSCTGTLIGCGTVVTAAHCFCVNGPTTDCTASGEVEATRQASLFFLQHGGAFGLQSVHVHPDYRFTERGDLAIVTLSRPAERIRPALVNQIRRPPRGTRGTIVGLGISSAFTLDLGIKSTGRVTLGDCVSSVSSSRHLCWRFDSPVGPAGEDSTVCLGDSGGPVFVELSGAARVAGVTSGIANNCQPPDVGFATDTFVYEDWIRSVAGEGLGASCDVTPLIGDAGTDILAASGELDATEPYEDHIFRVAPGAAELRIGLNGADFSGPIDAVFPNDFDLLVRRESAATREEFDCVEDVVGPYGYCGFQNPEPGTWLARVLRYAGTGGYQLTVSLIGSECIGDCDGNKQVTVDEIVTGVNTALGDVLISACSNMDADGNGAITVDEILTAISAALGGCPE